jgi:hypothetical protein
VRRAPLCAVIALVAAVVLPSANAAPKGEQHVLVVLASAGSEPYSVADVQRAIRDANAFFQRSSFGQVSLQADITPWLVPFTVHPGCGGSTDRSLEALVAPAKEAADKAGFDTSRYDEVVYSFGDSRCGFLGTTFGRQVLLTREPTVDLLVHELGHAFGLGHASGTRCRTTPLQCGIDATGDVFSPMGSGSLDFSAYEKFLLGWIPPQQQVSIPGTYTLVPPSSNAKLSRALVVETPDGSWWIEYRTRLRGLLFRFVDNQPPPSPFAPSSILMLTPTRADRPWIAKGETYRIPFSFRVTLAKATAQRAQVRIRP